jgi:hypothetical protein
MVGDDGSTCPAACCGEGTANGEKTGQRLKVDLAEVLPLMKEA